METWFEGFNCTGYLERLWQLGREEQVRQVVTLGLALTVNEGKGFASTEKCGYILESVLAVKFLCQLQTSLSGLHRGVYSRKTIAAWTNVRTAVQG